jgi:hypothetical protein
MAMERSREEAPFIEVGCVEMVISRAQPCNRTGGTRCKRTHKNKSLSSVAMKQKLRVLERKNNLQQRVCTPWSRSVSILRRVLTASH